MCHCTPEIRTPFCGKPECAMPWRPQIFAGARPVTLLPITTEYPAGTDLHDALADAGRIARAANRPVRFAFNELMITVKALS